MRQNTRDIKRFPLLFVENVTYGFRRNLFGLKRIGLGINAIVVVACVSLLWRADWNVGGSSGKRAAVVLLIAIIHAVYMALAVRRGAVWDSARAYGRELILSCEAFLVSSGAATKRAPRKKAPTENLPG